MSLPSYPRYLGPTLIRPAIAARKDQHHCPESRDYSTEHKFVLFVYDMSYSLITLRLSAHRGREGTLATTSVGGTKIHLQT